MASLNARFIAGAVAALCLALLVTASKLDPDTPKFMIESDATIVVPLIFAYVLED